MRPHLIHTQDAIESVHGTSGRKLPPLNVGLGSARPLESVHGAIDKAALDPTPMLGHKPEINTASSLLLGATVAGSSIPHSGVTSEWQPAAPLDGQLGDAGNRIQTFSTEVPQYSADFSSEEEEEEERCENACIPI